MLASFQTWMLAMPRLPGAAVVLVAGHHRGQVGLVLRRGRACRSGRRGHAGVLPGPGRRHRRDQGDLGVVGPGVATTWSSRVKSTGPLVGCRSAQVVPASQSRIEPVPRRDSEFRLQSWRPNRRGSTFTLIGLALWSARSAGSWLSGRRGLVRGHQRQRGDERGREQHAEACGAGPGGRRRACGVSGVAWCGRRRLRRSHPQYLKDVARPAGESAKTVRTVGGLVRAVQRPGTMTRCSPVRSWPASSCWPDPRAWASRGWRPPPGCRCSGSTTSTAAATTRRCRVIDHGANAGLVDWDDPRSWHADAAVRAICDLAADRADGGADLRHQPQRAQRHPRGRPRRRPALRRRGHLRPGDRGGLCRARACSARPCACASTRWSPSGGGSPATCASTASRRWCWYDAAGR